ncbi:TniQ family protein [Burkholderia diffusa]|uniref:TniQ family protein n=1 Tax=Burkholderia diffusa TaxID=488732 RepID=UPI0012DB545C|nr:hypothetical protein [Burkholderia diffusa]
MSFDKFNNGILSLSSICEGEAFGGYLARHRYNTTGSQLEKLYGSRRTPWILSGQIAEHVRICGNHVGTLDKVLSYHTLITGFCRFLPPEDATRVHEYHIGKPIRSIMPTVGLTANRGLGQVWSPGICMECLKEDISPTGQNYWRRDFLLSHIRYCSKHGTPIYDFCDVCVHGHRASYGLTAPDSKCLCGAHLIIRKQITTKPVARFELDIARGWSKLLDPKFCQNIQGYEILDLINQQAITLGIVDGHKIKWDKFGKFFDTSTNFSLSNSIGLLFRSARILRVLLGKATLRNPIHAIFMLTTLFDGWDGAESAINSYVRSSQYFPNQDEAIRGSRHEKSKGKTGNNNTNRRRPLTAEICRTYTKLKNKHPSLSHSNIVLLMGSPSGVTIKALRELGVNAVPSRREAFAPPEQDSRMAKDIERRWMEMKNANVRYRITVNKLVHGQSKLSGLYRPGMCKRYPQAIAALEKYSETPAMRTRRILRLDILNGVVRCCKPESADQLDHMSDHEVEKLWNRHCADLRRRRS